MTTNNTDGAALLPVTAEDRTAYCDYEDLDGKYRERVMSGAWDNVAGVQAFARFERDILSRAPLPATQEDAERSGVVTQEEVDAALAKFDGGLRRQSDERNARGYTTFYHPKDSMREVLEDFYARRKSTPQRQEYDGEAVREALKEAYDFIASQFRDPSLEAEGEWLDKEARPIIAKISAALAHPAQATPSAVSGDAGEGFDREWCITMAKKEAGHDIGAGVVAIDPSFPEQEGGE